MHGKLKTMHENPRESVQYGFGKADKIFRGIWRNSYSPWEFQEIPESGSGHFHPKDIA